MQIVLGVVMVVVGAAAAFNALPLIQQIEKVWPREYTRSDAHNLASTAFLVRWLGLFVALAGLAVILLAVL